MKFRIEGLRSLTNLIKELAIGLRNLKFVDNFNCFKVDVEISATSSYTVRNQLATIPTEYLVVSQTGNGLITKSSTDSWTQENLFFYNHGAETVTASIILFK